MSNLTLTEACEEIQTLFKTGWDAAAASTGVALLWADQDDSPPDDAPWAEVHVIHQTGNQASLTGGLGVTMFARQGIVSVSIRTVAGRSLTLNRQLGEVVLDIFERNSTPGGVWFRNVRYTEAPGRDGKWQQGNAIAEFTYDQIK